MFLRTIINYYSEVFYHQIIRVILLDCMFMIVNHCQFHCEIIGLILTINHCQFHCELFFLGANKVYIIFFCSNFKLIMVVDKFSTLLFKL